VENQEISFQAPVKFSYGREVLPMEPRERGWSPFFSPKNRKCGLSKVRGISRLSKDRKRKGREMEKTWSYKDYQIQDGLKPGSKHFQYFFRVSRGGEKKCNYCVWIEDEALSRFDPPGNFDAIVSSHQEPWSKWVREEIDAGALKSKVLRIGREGQKVVDLSDVKEQLSMD
jgi:hypothetical protein